MCCAAALHFPLTALCCAVLCRAVLWHCVLYHDIQVYCIDDHYTVMTHAAMLACQMLTSEAHSCQQTAALLKLLHIRNEKTTPFGVNFMRSQVLYWAAQLAEHIQV